MCCFRVVGSYVCACLLDLRVIVYAFVFVCCDVLHMCEYCMDVLLSCFFACVLVRDCLIGIWLCMRLDV